MIIHNASSGVLIISDLPGAESGTALTLQPGANQTIFNQVAQQSAQLAAFITGGQITVVNLSEPSAGTPVDNLEAQAGGGLPLAGGTMTGDIAMGGHKVSGLGAPSASGDAARKTDSDAALAAGAAAQTTASAALPKAGGAMTGAIAMGANKITGLAAGTATGDAARYDELTAAAAAAAAAQSTANAAQVAANLLFIDSAAGAGGAASAVMTVTGLLSTDTILAVSQKTPGANSLPLLGFSTQANNALTATWSADPGAGAVIRVAIKR